jgi:hypothetical protein
MLPLHPLLLAGCHDDMLHLLLPSLGALQVESVHQKLFEAYPGGLCRLPNCHSLAEVCITSSGHSALSCVLCSLLPHRLSHAH